MMDPSVAGAGRALAANGDLSANYVRHHLSLLWPLEGARLFSSPMLLLGSDPKAQRRPEFLDRPEDGDPSLLACHA
jgi:hypothetical protein